MNRAALAIVVFCSVPSFAAHRQVQNLVSETRGLKQQQQSAPPAQKAALQRQIDDRLSKLDAIATDEPKNPDTQKEIARAFLETKEGARALKRVDAAIELNPNDSQAYSLRASVDYSLGRMKEAGEDARRALKLDARNREAQAVLSLSAGRSSAGAAAANAPEPQPTASKTSSSSPADDAARRAQWQQGQRTADRRKVDDLLNEASNKLKLGDRHGALTAIDRAAKIDGGDARVHAWRARALVGGGATDKAAAMAQARLAVSQAPGSGEARLSLAEVLEAAGAPQDEFLAAYKAAAELDPAFGPAYEAALTRLHASPTDAAPRSQASLPDDGASAADLLVARLPDAARRGWPWLALAAAGAWLLLLFSRRQSS